MARAGVFPAIRYVALACKFHTLFFQSQKSQFPCQQGKKLNKKNHTIREIYFIKKV